MAVATDSANTLGTAALIEACFEQAPRSLVLWVFGLGSGWTAGGCAAKAIDLWLRFFSLRLGAAHL
jgi:hypothetical protein